MRKRTEKIIRKLGKKILKGKLEQPVHLLAVCSGGKIVASMISDYLNKYGVKSEYYEVWTNTISGKSKLWKTDFKKENYKGTAVIVEDVIWRGGHLPPIKEMLTNMNPEKRYYIASILDCNRKADFSVYR